MTKKLVSGAVAAIFSALVGVMADRYVAYNLTLTMAIIVCCGSVALGAFLISIWRKSTFGVAVAVFIMLAPAITSVLMLLSSRPPAPVTDAHAEIVSPSSGTQLETYTGQAPKVTVRGSLAGVPDGEHAWLAIGRDNAYWPLRSEITPPQGQWQREVSVDVPSDEQFSLVVLLVRTDKAQAKIESWLNKPADKPLPSTIGIQLTSVNALVVRRPCITSPASCLLSPTITPLPHELLYQTKASVFSAKLTQDSACHRADKKFGLDVRWTMSGDDYGGWGLKWNDTVGGHFNATTGFASLTLWVKGGSGGETMQIGIKDTRGKELKTESRSFATISGTDWTKVSVPLSSYPGIDLSTIENVNIGFNSAHGSGQICIDQLGFE